MNINAIRLRSDHKDLPNALWVKILKHCDSEDTLDQALRVSTCMRKNVMQARGEYWHEKFNSTMRFTNEALPSILELKDRSCVKPRWEKIRKTLRMFDKLDSNGPLNVFDSGASDYDINSLEASILYEETLPNGTTYTGGFKKGQRNGFGVLETLGISKYKGQFKDGQMCGCAITTLPDGECLEGEFRDGKLHGQGKVKRPNGECLEGEFRHGKPHGQGKITLSNGKCAEGEFCDGKLHGQGKITLPNGECLEGEFRDGKLHGQEYPHYLTAIG